MLVGANSESEGSYVPLKTLYVVLGGQKLLSRYSCLGSIYNVELLALGADTASQKKKKKKR